MTPIANGESGASARAKINAVLPQPIAFSTSVPLDGRKVMAAQAVAAALAFSPAAGPQLGGECYVELTADGAHAPSFAGFVEDGSSAGFFNVAGVVNRLLFSFWGTTPRVTVWQDANVVPFVMQTAAVPAAAAGTIAVGFDRDMNRAVTPAASAFTLANSGGADAVTAVAWADARMLTLTKSRTTLAGDAVTLSYAVPGSNPLADLNGNVAGARAGLMVTNGVAAAPVYLRLAAASNNLAETADGAGYDYAAAAATSYGASPLTFGVPSQGIPANTDGWAEFTAAAPGPSGPLIGLSTSASPSTFADIALAIYLDAAATSGGNDGTRYSAFVAGAGIAFGAQNGTPTAMAAGDVVRVGRSGATAYVSVSKDGGASYTVVHSVAIAAAAALRFLFVTGTTAASGRIALPKGSPSVA